MDRLRYSLERLDGPQDALSRTQLDVGLRLRRASQLNPAPWVTAATTDDEDSRAAADA